MHLLRTGYPRRTIPRVGHGLQQWRDDGPLERLQDELRFRVVLSDTSIEETNGDFDHYPGSSTGGRGLEELLVTARQVTP